MAIIIKYTETKDHVIINKLSGLVHSKLPNEYLLQKYNFYYGECLGDGDIVTMAFISNKSSWPCCEYILKERTKYSKKDFISKLIFIKKCGKKLRQINKQIKEESKPKVTKKTIRI